MIYLGADHRGYELKGKLKSFLADSGFIAEDLGTHSTESVDYPLIAHEVGRKVVEDPYNRGIVICGSGAGVCIASNKLQGIRAGVAWNEHVAKTMRNDDNI